MKADKAKDLTVEELSDELENEYSTNTKKPNRWLRNLLFTLLVLIILALGTVGGAFLFVKQSLSPVLNQATTNTSVSTDTTDSTANTGSAGQADNDEGFQGVEFEVKPGWGASRVASALEADGFIKNGQIFSLWLRYKGYDRDGYDRAGYNGEGYDRDGYNRDGYNYKGYDRDGFNAKGHK